MRVCAPPGLTVAKASPFAKGWVFIPHVFPWGAGKVDESPQSEETDRQTRITEDKDPGGRLGLRRKLGCGVQKQEWGRERCRKRRHQRLFGVQAFPLLAFKTWSWSVASGKPSTKYRKLSWVFPDDLEGWDGEWWWERGPRGREPIDFVVQQKLTPHFCKAIIVQFLETTWIWKRRQSVQ